MNKMRMIVDMRAVFEIIEELSDKLKKITSF